jgi:RNA polymerase sigma factor for flagellar operon FliA
MGMNGRSLASGKQSLCDLESSQASNQFDGFDEGAGTGRSNAAERDKLILENLAVVERVVGKVASRLPSSIDRDDLHSVGMLGLITAAERFDQSRSVRFKTYAEVRVRGAMIDYLRSMSWAPRSLFRRIRQIDEARRAVENQSLRAATASEVAGQLGMTSDAYDVLMREIQRVDVSHVDSLEDEHPISVVNRATGPEADPSVHLERKEALEIISQSIQGLPERLKLTLWLYYYEQLTMKEVGSVLGVNEARASQLHSKAIAALRSAVSARLIPGKPATKDTFESETRTEAAL